MTMIGLKSFGTLVQVSYVMSRFRNKYSFIEYLPHDYDYINVMYIYMYVLIYMYICAMYEYMNICEFIKNKFSIVFLVTVVLFSQFTFNLSNTIILPSNSLELLTPFQTTSDFPFLYYLASPPLIDFVSVCDLSQVVLLLLLLQLLLLTGGTINLPQPADI